MPECTPVPLPTLELTGCVANPNASAISWRGRSEDSPFVNPRTCEYSIVVDKAYIDPDTPVPETIQYDSPGTGADFEERMRGYAAYGVDKLLEYYNKYHPYPTLFETVAYDSIVAREAANPASSYYAPGRPNSNIKVLVTLPYDDLNLLGNIAYVPDPGAPTIDVTYDVRLIKTKVFFVSEVIKKHYSKKHGAPFSSARKLDLNREANFMKRFVGSLNKFLDENGVDIDLGSVLNTREENIKFIFQGPPEVTTEPGGYELLDVEYTDLGGTTRSLRVGLNVFKKEITDTTNALIYWTEIELFSNFNKQALISQENVEPKWTYSGGVPPQSLNPTWVEFVEKYIYPPEPVSMTIGQKSNRLKNFLYGGEDLAGVFEYLARTKNVLQWSGVASGVMEGNISLIPFLDNYVMTKAKAADERGIVFNHHFQANQAGQANNLVHLNTDSAVIDIQWENIAEQGENELWALYANVLNHIDIKYFAGILAECTGMDPDIVDPAILDLIKALGMLLYTLPNMALSTIRIPSGWGWLEDITEDFANYIARFIFEIIQGLIVSLVRYLFDQLDKICDEQFDFPAVSLEGLLSDNFKDPEEASNFYNDLTMGLGDGTETSDLLRELLADISAVLTTKELCMLLRGTASDEVLTVVYNIVQLDKYLAFQDQMKTKLQISSFFASLGGLVKSNLCELGTITGQLCEDGFFQAEREFLLEENSGLSSEQIENQIAALRAEREELLDSLAEIVNSEEGIFNEKALELMNNGAMAQAAANHPSSQNALDQMIETSFFPPLISMTNEALGYRETPYHQVESEEVFSVGASSMTYRTIVEHEKNRGLLNTLTTVGEFWTLMNIFQNSALTRYGFVPGAGMDYFVTVESGIGPDADADPNIAEEASWWSYQNLLPGFLLFAFGIPADAPPVATGKSDNFNILYGPSAPVPSWWGVEDENMDLAQIYSDGFFARTPFVGIDEISIGDITIPAPSGPTIKKYEAAGEELENLDLGDLGNLLTRDSDYVINVFNDLPNVVADGLVPSYEQIETFTDASIVGTFSKQVNTYAYHVLNQLEEKDPAVAAGIDYENLAGTYQTVFNDVMRILYSFVSDSEFSFSDIGIPWVEDESTDKTFFEGNDVLNEIGSPNTSRVDMLDSLKNNFKDPTQLLSIAGIENIKETMGEALFSSFGDGVTADPMAAALSEVSLRYLIRIYILEIFLKNIYWLTSVPEKRSDRALAEGGYTADLLPYGGEEITNDNFESMLDLKDTIDPIMVSFITEYIIHSDSKVESESCAAFRDVAQSLADAELAKEAPEEGFLSISIVDAEGEIMGDTLAYYPPRDAGEDINKAALKYYVAKELEDFIDEFQSFIELSNLKLDFEGSDITDKRPLMKSFLDKMETVGYNVTPYKNVYHTDGTTGEALFDSSDPPIEDEDDHNYREFLKIGEGLYLEFYLRRGEDHSGVPFTPYGTSNEVTYADLLGTFPDFTRLGEFMEPLAGDSFGLRMCVRDRTSEDAPYDGEATTPFSTFASGLFDLGASEVATYAVEGEDDRVITFAQVEKSYEPIKGFPIVELEIPYGDVLDALGYTDPDYASFDVRYGILEYLKEQLILQDDFRVLFEYAFPVKKMFNYLFIIMTNSVDSFLLNPQNEQTYVVDGDLKPIRDVLIASAIDPEQFAEAKSIIKGILENVLNSNNYNYINDKVNSAGGVGNMMLNESLKDL